MSEEFDTYMKADMICPYCGKIQQDDWELSHNEDNVDCAHCGETFEYQRFVYWEYTTKKTGR